jgi:alpha-ketoglutarate-dependent taurine dioxygenase
MAIIGFDEVHAETWTVSRELAVKAAASKPEYVYYGHLADVLRLDSQYKVVRLTQEWSDDTLRGIDVLVIAHPANPQHEGVICQGSPSFSDQDRKKIEAFLHRGGGLFVIGEHNAERWGNNLNEILSSSNIIFNDDTVQAPKDAADAHLLVQHFTCKDIETHPITASVSRISFHRGCSLSCAAPAKALIMAPGGQCVFGASEVGAGRVAVIGDSDLFSIPYVGGFDNLRLFQNAVQWLAKVDATTDQQFGLQMLRKQAYDLGGVQHNLDISKVPGGPVLDVANSVQVASIVESLARSNNPYENPEAFLDEAELYFHQLPTNVRRAVSLLRRHGNEHGVLLIRNLPIDSELPGTPANSRRALDKKTFMSESILAIFSRGLGEPFAYKQEKDGELFQNICPTKANITALSSESATILLDFHTETAFHPYMPDFVMLLCLRSDHEHRARTEIASTNHIIPLLPLKYRSALFQPLYRTGIDFSFGSVSGTQGNGPLLPVFFGNVYDPFMKFDLDLMKGETPEAEEALLQIKGATNAAKNYVRLLPGDLMIIDNRRSVHSRSEFTPRFDGTDRWLQRCYVLRDLAAAEELRMTRDRLIAVEFGV